LNRIGAYRAQEGNGQAADGFQAAPQDTADDNGKFEESLQEGDNGDCETGRVSKQPDQTAMQRLP